MLLFFAPYELFAQIVTVTTVQHNLYIYYCLYTCSSCWFNPSMHGTTALSGPWPSSKRCLHSSISPACLLDPCTPRTCNASFWIMSSHIFLDFPVAFVLVEFPLIFFFWDPFPMMWSAHPSCLILISPVICKDYKLYCFIYGASAPSLVLGHIFFLLSSFQMSVVYVLPFLLGQHTDSYLKKCNSITGFTSLVTYW